MDSILSTSLVELINWFNSLKSVTDFEGYAISKIRETCKKNNIGATDVDGGLLVGNPDANIVFMAHVDRIGFIALSGILEEGSILELAYISNSASIVPQKIQERFLRTLLTGYDPLTGEELFIASLLQESNYQAQICSVVRNHQQVINRNNPIPVTAVRPIISQTGNYLQGFFDNSVGLAIALTAVAKYPQQLSCVFTVSEEGGGYQQYSSGGRGAQKYIHNHKPEKLLVVIDVRPSSLVASDDKPTFVSKGVVLREAEWRKGKDGKNSLLLNADDKALAYIKEYSQNNNIKYQTFSGLGITEAGRAYEALGHDSKLRCIWLQPPIANEHTQFEIVALTDLVDTLKIAEELRKI